ncbi:mitochondrial import inner membrane translocase subunit TIM44-like [Sycon ciliatum]|uniref:mitochondrial import inner membrane translocase subunit TIM44-like n=1 Tax=Sycon ciliatum TaxID=27933 RepID=UPI0031F5F1D5
MPTKCLDQFPSFKVSTIFVCAQNLHVHLWLSNSGSISEVPGANVTAGQYLLGILVCLSKQPPMLRSFASRLPSASVAQRCACAQRPPVVLSQRFASDGGKPKGFFETLRDSLQAEWSKNKELKDSVEQLQKAAQSENVSKIKTIVDSGKSYVQDGAEKIGKQLHGLKDPLSKAGEQVTKNPAVGKFKEQLKNVKMNVKVPEQVSKVAQNPTVSKVTETIKEDIVGDTGKLSQPYEAPTKDQYRRRVVQEGEEETEDEKAAPKIKEDTETKGVELHSSAKFSQQWENFKNNNRFINGMFDLKRQFDESESVGVRALRFVTDGVSNVVGGMLTPNETSQTLEAIVKVDKDFDPENFLNELQLEIIPTVLEGFLRADMDLLREWCHDRAYGVLSALLTQQQQLGLTNQSQVLELSNVELIMGKMMEPGPVLIISFSAQQLTKVVNKTGEVVEGGDDMIQNNRYVWALCRDQTIFDARSAWRILEFGILAKEDIV